MEITVKGPHELDR